MKNVDTNLIVGICAAKCKRTGERCRRYTCRGKRVCYVHGGKSTGAKTAEGKLRCRMANLKTGRYTDAAKAEARQVRDMIKQAKDALLMAR